mgnify:CR=1 FL=1
MGTTYSITITGFKDQEANFKNQIDSLLSVLNKHFSTYLEDSEISNINTQESNSFTLSDEFLYVLQKALYYCEISDGHYDVTIAPLVDLWGFGSSGNMKIPEQKPLSALRMQLNQLVNLPQTKGLSDDAKLREAANDFEAIFVQQMLKTMRETSLESNLIPKSEGEKVFQSMLDENYSRLAAKSGSLGLGEMIYNQLTSKKDGK